MKIVLVRPQIDVNIGAVARVMGNFGINELRIVNPKCNHLSEVSLSTSCKFSDILINSVLYNSVESSIYDCKNVFAVSKRSRDLVKDVSSPEFLNNIDHSECALLFGPENNGLSNEDLKFSDRIIKIDTYGSMNLSHSVSILCYELTKTYSLTNKSFVDRNDLADKFDLVSMVEYLNYALCNVDFFSDDKKRARVINNISSIFSRSNITKNELNTMRGIFRSLYEFRG